MLVKELEHVPEPLLDELLDLVQQIKRNQIMVSETALLSEKSLAKEWLTKEEDEAWRDL